MPVSIVIPTRNRGALLREAVVSAVRSDAAEVIVADGGSDDGSVEAVRALDDRIRIVQGDWRNAAATRNAGAAAASSPLLGFLDSDDRMRPEKVTALARHLDDPQVGLVHGRFDVIDAAGALDASATAMHRAVIAEGERRGTTHDALALVCRMFTSATLVRRAAFDEIGGYDEDLDAYEDWDLYLRLSQHWQLVYARDVVAEYRIWPGNVGWRNTATWTTRVAQKHLHEPQSAAARYAFRRRLAESYNVLGDARRARAAALAAVAAAPLRGVRDGGVWRPLIRSLLPRGSRASAAPPPPD